MNAEEITSYCMSKPNVTDGFPFRKETLVFKVAGKVFCLLRLDQQPLTINVKCDAEKAVELREKYSAITPGYHMNKKYWNTIALDGSLNSTDIRKFIDDSYLLVEAKK
jgi:predicted DNA-binding protein (MmcQ/YjbR family)